jgi:WD40 repeat protein/serine/threonine protein kinase
MVGRSTTPHELLLGLYALQGRAVELEELIAAVRAWADCPGEALSEFLAVRGVLDAGMLERLAGRVASDLGRTGSGDGPGAVTGSAGPDRSDVPSDPGTAATITYAGRPAPVPGDDIPRGAGQADTSGTRGPRFRVIRPHARGGLGEVFLAHDTELNRSVALKELQARHAHDRDSQARFLLEAELTGTLEHPGIVPIYSLGRHEDGRPYYAMRLIRGETLRDAIERFHRKGSDSRAGEDRQLSFRRLLRSVIDATNAVAYAHSRGVIHRDLKPENIMLGRFGETLVVDWGVAKRVSDAQDVASGPPAAGRPPGGDSLTHHGSVIGTPRYMSPEQASGEPERVGPASDIYSLGAILYCVLIGHAPFPDGDLSSVLGRARRGIFPAPRRLRRSVDPALEAICLKAMALEPADRYATALDLAGALETWLADVRYRGEQELALSQVKASLARLCFERAHHGFGRKAHDEGMLWLARALESAPPDPPELQRVIRTSLGGWYAGEGMMERGLRHGGEIHAVAFCPEGRRLATAGGDRVARLWDVSTGIPLSPPLRHDGPVRAVAFSPDGTLVATAGDDGMIRRWDALTGRPHGNPMCCGAAITSLGFSPDGSRIAAASGPGGPFLWDATTGMPAHQPAGYDARILAVAFSPDGTTLAVACEDGDVRLVEAASGTPLGAPLAHGAAVPALAFDPDGGRLLTGSLDGHARLWDLTRRATVVTVAPEGAIRGLAFRPGGGAFAMAGGDGAARLRESTTGRPIGERLDHPSPVDCLAFRPDGTMIATGSQDGTVRLWCASTGLPIGPPLAHGGTVRMLIFSPDGRRLASAGSDPTVRCWTPPDPVEADVERISCWVRVTTELEFDAGDAIRRMDGATSWDLRRRLSELGGPPFR